VPMEVVLRTRNFDEKLYAAVAPHAGRSVQEKAAAALDDLF